MNETTNTRSEEVVRQLAASLPQYLTREQAGRLAGRDSRTIDRWRRQGYRGQKLKTYWTGDKAPLEGGLPGEVRVAKVELLALMGRTHDGSAAPAATS